MTDARLRRDIALTVLVMVLAIGAAAWFGVTPADAADAMHAGMRYAVWVVFVYSAELGGG